MTSKPKTRKAPQSQQLSAQEGADLDAIASDLARLVAELERRKAAGLDPRTGKPMPTA